MLKVHNTSVAKKLAKKKKKLSSPEMQDPYVTKAILWQLVKYEALHTKST